MLVLKVENALAQSNLSHIFVLTSNFDTGVLKRDPDKGTMQQNWPKWGFMW